jgi:hypothetical protein
MPRAAAGEPAITPGAQGDYPRGDVVQFAGGGCRSAKSALPDPPRSPVSAACQSLALKIFHFTEIRKRRMFRPSRPILEGRSYVVTTCGPGMRWTRQRRREGAGRAGVSPVSPVLVETNGAVRFVSPAGFRQGRQGRERLRRSREPSRTAKSCGPDARETVRQAFRDDGAANRRRIDRDRELRRGQERNAPRGEHDISRQPIAQGRPGVRPHLYAAVRFFLRVHFAQRTAGAGRHPVFPAPS